MQNFKTEVLKRFEKPTFKQTTIKITKRGEHDITAHEIAALTKELQKDKPTVKIAIRALGPLGWRDLKSFDSDLKLLYESEYLDGRVRETTKFTSHYSLLVFTILNPK